jgi:cytochrome P450
LIAEVIAWKRNNPADDLLTALVAAEHDGDVLSDAELVAQVVLLYVAGHETTENLIAGGMLALFRHPDQLALLRERPDLAGAATEELLRYDSPVQLSRRITLAPHTILGHVIPAGSFVIASLASANRDERFWGPDADSLRLDRPCAQARVLRWRSAPLSRHVTGQAGGTGRVRQARRALRHACPRRPRRVERAQAYRSP